MSSFDVNLSNDRVEVSTTVLDGSKDYEPFMCFKLTTDLGVTFGVILPDAATARKIAGELHRAADILDGRTATYRTTQATATTPPPAVELVESLS